MKKYFLLLLMLLPAYVFGQDLRYSDVPNYSGVHTFKGYLASTGDIFQVGDEITIGPASRPSGTYQYMTQVIVLSMNGNLAGNIYEGMKAKINRIATDGVRVTFNCSIKPFVGVYNIRAEEALRAGELVSKNRKKASAPQKDSVAISEEIAPRDSADIMETEAISKLKKAKQMLDLELITQNQYDSLKFVYGRYIRL